MRKKYKEIEEEKSVSILNSQAFAELIQNKTLEGKNIELLFYVNGIEPELLLDRQEKIKQFYLKRIHQNIS